MRKKKSLLNSVFTTILVVAVGIVPILTSVIVHAEASPYLTLNSFTGHPGQTLVVSGGNYSPNKSINIFVNNVKSNSTILTTSAFGEFGPVNVDIPVNASQGGVVIKGVVSEAETASNTYYVQPFTPSLNVVSTSNTPFSTIKVNGNGFAPNESVLLSLNTSTASITTDSKGDFLPVNLNIPNVASKTYTVNGKGQSSGAEALSYFYIGGFFPSTYPSSYYLLPGQTLSFSGSGFANSELIDVYEGISTTPLITFSVDVNGTFTNAGSIIMPVNYKNTSKTFNLKGRKSMASASTTMSIGQYNPTVSPSLYYILPGNTLMFSGSSFAPSETINVFEGLSSTPLTSLSSDTFGGFKNLGSIVIPYTYANTDKTLKFLGTNSDSAVNLSITISKLYSQISPSSYYIKPGQKFNVSGTGYAPHEKVNLDISGLSTVQATANILGNVLFQDVVMPFTKLQSVNLTATGVISASTASNTVSVGAYYPYVSSSEYYVLPGTILKFTGSDFGPDEDVNVNIGLNKVATLHTDATGTFMPNTYTVAFGTTGAVLYSFTGQKTNAKANLSIQTAAFYPSVESDNYYVQPGNIINVKGTGFAPGETVNIKFGTFSATTIADKYGITGIVPATVPFNGTKTTIDLIMTGALSLAQASTTITLAPFYPQISPSTYYDKAGKNVTFTGSGFVPGETVSISKNKAILGTINADSKGKLTTVPYSLPFGIDSVSYEFLGNFSNQKLSLTIGIAQLYAGIILSNYYSVGGTPITITGNDFLAGELVNIKFGGVDLGNVTATALGTISLATNVPFATAGEKTVTAKGLTSGAQASTTFTQAPVYVSAQLGSYAGAPGTAITFIGSGFLPNEPVQITTDRTGATVVHTFNADATGKFNNATYLIPADFIEGNLTLTIKGTHSLTPQIIVFYVTHS